MELLIRLDGILVASNDDVEMEKAIKYNDILTNAVMLQNVSDMMEIIAEFIDDGHNITKDDMSYLCPYWSSHLKRFGDMAIDIKNINYNAPIVSSKKKEIALL